MTDPIADRTAVYVERARQLAPLIDAHAEHAERTAQLPPPSRRRFTRPASSGCSILATSRYEVVGRILLGLDPGSPII